MKLECTKCGWIGVEEELEGRLDMYGDCSCWCPTCGADDNHLVDHNVKEFSISIDTYRSKPIVNMTDDMIQVKINTSIKNRAKIQSLIEQLCEDTK